jgi:hypothetical protein
MSCFRDDIVFAVFLYQRWAYKVDHTRVNEFGQRGDQGGADKGAILRGGGGAEKGAMPRGGGGADKGTNPRGRGKQGKEKKEA